MKQVKKSVHVCIEKCSYVAKWALLNRFPCQANDALSTVSAKEGSVKSKGKGPECCLGQVFKFKLGHFCFIAAQVHSTHAATSRVENYTQISPC
jgi:hypothetical protein